MRWSRQLDDAEVRLKGRERVVGDLGAGGRNDRQERGLAGVRLPDETDVGDELELQLELADHAFLARLPLARGLVGGRREERIALPASPALRDHEFLAVLQYLGDDLPGLGLAQDRARRHGHDDVRPGTPALVRAHAVLAALGHPVVAVGVVEQGREVRVAAHDHAAAAAAIAAVGATHGVRHSRRKEVQPDPPVPPSTRITRDQ